MEYIFNMQHLEPNLDPRCLAAQVEDPSSGVTTVTASLAAQVEGPSSGVTTVTASSGAPTSSPTSTSSSAAAAAAASSSLSSLSSFSSTAAYRCFMAPHLVAFINTPFFLTNSKYDEFQLSSILAEPCNPGSGTPCNATDVQRIDAYVHGQRRHIDVMRDTEQRQGNFCATCVVYCSVCVYSSLYVLVVHRVEHRVRY
jgi:hypothetical protein